jgi:CHAT domain-containing protein
LLTVLKKKATALGLLAEIYQAETDYDNYLRLNILALQTINTCTNLIHRLRIGYMNEESKLLLAEKQESTFMDAISIAYQLYRFTKEKQYLLMAFEFTEKSKSASFLASVKDMEAKQFGGIPDSLLAREQYLKINISNYKEMLFQENQQEKPDSQKTNLYSAKIFQHNEEYNRLIRLFEQEYPRYYSFKYENKVITIDEIQRNLKKKEAIVEYVVNEPTDTIHPGQLYRFIITKDKVDLSLENIGFEYVRQIGRLHSFLSNPTYLYTRKNEFIEYCTSAYKLYHTLLAPSAELISGKHLTIIPDDKLSYIPFDALLSAMPDTSKMDFRNLNYLVYDYPVNYSYSSTLLFNYFEADKHVSKKLLAFSPNYDYPEDTLTSPGEKLSPLPGAKTEVNLLNRYISSDLYVDAMASEKNFKKLAPGYDILHLAMHTILNDSLPMFSRLAFAKPATGEKEDGWLNTHEIYNMKLKARMAVLSACNTGKGRLQKGEGVMSLARGFLYAGCPSIIMTLWEVEDLSGTEIMQDFYNFIAKGKEKDDALRLAKLKHIQEADPLKAHPHYWLGYVNIGNREPLYSNRDIYFILIVVFALVLVIIDQIVRNRRTGRK